MVLPEASLSERIGEFAITNQYVSGEPIIALPMIRNGACHFVEVEAKLFGLHDELLQLSAQQVTSFRCRGHRGLGNDGANAGQYLEQTFRQQLRDDLVGRVRIDFQFLAQRADGRKRVARTHLPGDDGFLGGVNHLLVNRSAGLKRQAKWDHVCTITHSTLSSQEEGLASK